MAAGWQVDGVMAADSTEVAVHVHVHAHVHVHGARVYEVARPSLLGYAAHRLSSPSRWPTAWLCSSHSRDTGRKACLFVCYRGPRVAGPVAAESPPSSGAWLPPSRPCFWVGSPQTLRCHYSWLASAVFSSHLSSQPCCNGPHWRDSKKRSSFLQECGTI